MTRTIRGIALAFLLTLPASALAEQTRAATTPLTTTTSGGLQRATPEPPDPAGKAPYFYAAYSIVWAVLFGYAFWIAQRVKAIEDKLER